ncbi:MAG: SRPBCC family protein [Lysobacter sp.]
MATLYHQVWTDAPPARLYEAISTESGIAGWWDKPTVTDTAAGYVLEFSPGAEHGVLRMKVLERTPSTRVEWECISTHPNSSPASAWTGTHLSFDILERDNVVALSGFEQDQDRITILDFRHSGWDENSEYFGFCNFAWGEALLKLKQTCESP